MKIDTNIPAPVTRPGRTSTYDFPWDRMKIGDSFLTACHRDTIYRRIKLRRLATGQEFTVRKQAGGWRVWRIE